MKKVETEKTTLYLGDCEEILPELPVVDALVTDPPYGIGEAAGKNRSRGCIAKPTDYGVKDWDNKKIKTDLINQLIDRSKQQIIFGGNYYDLPPTSCWFIWDKMNGNTDFADFEMAWTNLKTACRKIEWLWNGMLRKDNEKRFHPTQKPVGVMTWCIDKLKDSDLILDPFMGSGTTGVAAVNLGRRFIGIEREEKYFEVALRRIEEAEKQGSLFSEEFVAQSEQLGFELSP